MHWPARSYRVSRHVRIFKVRFVGEGGIDSGGLYRECFSEICKELMNPALGILIPCPNSKNDAGRNRDTFVPAPSKAMQKFRFLGRLMGLALRSGELLSLRMAPAVWKELTLQAVTKEDMRGVDVLSFGMIDGMRNTKSKEMFDHTFDDEVFAGLRTDSKRCPLVPHGTRIPVTFSRRLTYASYLYAFRKHEFTAQISAMRMGLAEVVPKTALVLFDGAELQKAVCGETIIDLEVLKRHTTYEGYSGLEPVVQFFWQALRRFDNDLRVKFLQFVWGRSRLPQNESMWETSMRVHSCGGARNPDARLPLSHTCFFQIDLPRYTNAEACYNKLKIAVEETGTFEMG